MEKKIDRLIIFPLVGLLCVNVLMYSKIRNLEDRIDKLFNRLDQTRSSLSSSIDGISYNISREMQKDSSMINKFSFEYGNIKNKTVDMVLSISPKSIYAGDRLYFAYKYGEAPNKLVEAQSNDGVNYNAVIVVPIGYEVELDFVVDDGTTKKVEKLDSIPSIEKKLLSSFMVGEIGGFIYNYPSKGLSFKNATYSFDHHLNSNDETSSLTDVTLILEHNGDIVKTYPMIIDTAKSHDFFDSYSVTINDFSLKLEIDDIFEVYITAKDKRGFNIKAPIEKFIVDKNGIRSPEPRNEIIIY